MRPFFLLTPLFFLLVACQTDGGHPVRTYDYTLKDQATPRHMNRDDYSAVEAAEAAEEDDVCVGPFCSCGAE